MGRQGMREAYLTGRGIIKIRGKTSIETTADGKSTRLLITEMPYQQTKPNSWKKLPSSSVKKTYRDYRDEG